MMMRKGIYLLLLVSLCLTIDSLNGQTAMFGTNPLHTGFYDAGLPSDLLLIKKWKFKTGGMIFSSAVVVNDIIYFGSDDSCLYALDTAGVEKWKFKSNGIIRSAPAVKDTVVYINNYGGMFYAINTHTGQEIWSFATEGEMHFSHIGLFGWTPSDMLMDDPWDFYTSSPVITDTIVYFGGGRNVYALHAGHGNQIWKYEANDIIHSSPAVADSILCFGGWSGRFYALDAFTGVRKWSYQTGTDGTHLMQGIQSSPSVIDTIVVFGARDAKVYALNAITGSKIWSTSFGSSWMPGSFAYYNETVFTGSSEGGGLKALNLFDGRLKFAASKNFFYTFSSPAVTSETVFAGCMNGSLFAVDVNTGKIKCRFDTDGRISDPLNAILDNGTLNPDVFNPVSGYPYTQAVEYVRRLLTAGSIASTPVIDKDIVYIGSSDSCLYAIQDQGGCKPKILVSADTIDLGIISPSVSTDTSYYVFNRSECPDSIRVYAGENTNAAVKAALEINPSAFTLSAGDSVKISISIDPSGLTTQLFNASILSESLTNRYQSSVTVLSFKKETILNVPEAGKEQSAGIYPNPFTEFIHVKADVGAALMIMNPAGTVVLKKILDEADTQLDLGYLQKGIYLVMIQDDGHFYTARILKD